MKIVLLEQASLGNDHQWQRLKQFGELVCYQKTRTIQEAQARIAGAEIVIVDQFPLTKTVLEQAQQLKLIVVSATGTDAVDLAYAKSRFIKVCSVDHYATVSVAQHTIALALNLIGKLPRFAEYVASGSYLEDHQHRYTQIQFHELLGKTWGLVGYGSISRRVAEIATAFECKVIFYSPSGRSYESNYEQVDLPELLKISDIISVHTPLNKKTEQMFGKKEFSQMKTAAVFINVARGKIVDESALVEAVETEMIAAAGLDVMATEPLNRNSPLLKITGRSNVLMTPHIAFASVEAKQRLIEGVVLNIQNFLESQN